MPTLVLWAPVRLRRRRPRCALRARPLSLHRCDVAFTTRRAIELRALGALRALRLAAGGGEVPTLACRTLGPLLTGSLPPGAIAARDLARRVHLMPRLLRLSGAALEARRIRARGFALGAALVAIHSSLLALERRGRAR